MPRCGGYRVPSSRGGGHRLKSEVGFCRARLDRLRAWLRIFYLMLAAPALSSCAVGPDFQVPGPPAITNFLFGRGGDRVPGRTVVRGAEIPAQWWELFRSPALDRLVQDAIAYNADLAAAEAAVRAAQANALAQRGALVPTVRGTFDASRQKPESLLAPTLEGGASIFNLFPAQVRVTYGGDVGGGTRREIESADAQTEMQAFQREGVYL